MDLQWYLWKRKSNLMIMVTMFAVTAANLDSNDNRNTLQGNRLVQKFKLSSPSSSQLVLSSSQTQPQSSTPSATPLSKPI